MPSGLVGAVFDLCCDFGLGGHGSGAVIRTVIWAARRARQGASHFAAKPQANHSQITAQITAKSQPNPNDLLGAKRLVGAVIWSVICAVISDPADTARGL